MYIFKNIIHYNFLTDALNCLPLSSKSSNRSKLAHAGESNTQSPDDEILYSLSTGLKGDANLELGNYDKALNYYVSAANDYVNDFTTPYFMMKQAFVHELNEDYNSALKIYESIKEKYSQSKEGLSIDKYISSASNMELGFWR